MEMKKIKVSGIGRMPTPKNPKVNFNYKPVEKMDSIEKEIKKVKA